MKPFRVVKHREKDQPVENDLRGLGQTSLFDDMSPDPVLTLEKSTDSQSELASRLSLVKQGDHQYQCVNSKLSHKEKAINLFAFALALKVNSNINSSLSEKQRLHEALSEASGHQSKKTSSNLPATMTGIRLDPAVQLHLHQAGFQISPTETHQTLSDTQAGRMWTEMQPKQHQSQQHKKVG